MARLTDRTIDPAAPPPAFQRDNDALARALSMSNVSGKPTPQKKPKTIKSGPRTELGREIARTAKEMGVSAEDLATIISYETAGSFDPEKKGPRTQWGRHKGLIQWGEPQARKYLKNDFSIPSQMQGIKQYMKDAGVKPGMGTLDMYSAVNAGRVGRYNASDANNGGAPGTVRDKVNDQMGGHRRKAQQLLQNEGVKIAPPVPSPNPVNSPNPLPQGVIASAGMMDTQPYPHNAPIPNPGKPDAPLPPMRPATGAPGPQIANSTQAAQPLASQSSMQAYAAQPAPGPQIASAVPPPGPTMAAAPAAGRQAPIQPDPAKVGPGPLPQIEAPQRARQMAALDAPVGAGQQPAPPPQPTPDAFPASPPTPNLNELPQLALAASPTATDAQGAIQDMIGTRAAGPDSMGKSNKNKQARMPQIPVPQEPVTAGIPPYVPRPVTPARGEVAESMPIVQTAGGGPVQGIRNIAMTAGQPSAAPEVDGRRRELAEALTEQGQGVWARNTEQGMAQLAYAGGGALANALADRRDNQRHQSLAEALQGAMSGGDLSALYAQNPEMAARLDAARQAQASAEANRAAQAEAAMAQRMQDRQWDLQDARSDHERAIEMERMRQAGRDTRTGNQKDYEATQADAGFGEFLANQNAARSPTTNIDLGSKVTGEVAKTLIGEAATVRGAVEELGAIQEARRALDAGPTITGAGAETVRLPAARLGALFGITDPEIVANTEVLQANLAERILEKAGSLKGVLSDRDMEILRAAAAGSIGYNEQSLRKVLDAGERTLRQGVTHHNTMVDGLMQTDPSLEAYRPMLGVDLPDAYQPDPPAQLNFPPDISEQERAAAEDAIARGASVEAVQQRMMDRYRGR